MNAHAENTLVTAGNVYDTGNRESTKELRRSVASGLLVRAYKSMRGPGTATTRRFIVRVLTVLEGGQMRSFSLRRIMNEVHGVEVGAHSYGCFDPVRFPPGIRIGRYVSIGPNVAAYRRNHPMDRLSLHPYFYRPDLGARSGADVRSASLEICAGSWLGANAIILPGCRRIGRGAVVAAGAVLTRDVPDYAVVGGNPASLIRYRFSTQRIADAEATKWWLQSPAELNRLAGDMTSSWEPETIRSSEDGSDD